MVVTKNENLEKKITIPNGYLHILPLYLVISEFGIASDVLSRKDKNTLPIFTTVFRIIALLSFSAGVYFYFLGLNPEFSYVLIPLFLCSLYISIKWRNKSNQKIIERSTIRNIQLKKIMFNPTFVILFKTENGKMKERLIMMDTKYPDRIDAILKILTEENLMRPDLQPDLQNIITEYKESGSKSKEYKKTAGEEDESHTPKTEYKRDEGGYLKDY